MQDRLDEVIQVADLLHGVTREEEESFDQREYIEPQNKEIVG